MKRAVLCVGVNGYLDPGINNLEFAEADATELYAFFKRQARCEDVRHLASPEADQVLDLAREMVAGLAAGDLFVFFFAGHGYEFQRRQLLLCPKVRLSRLEYFQQTVPVDLLKQETRQRGVDRVFVLDACRKDLQRTRSAPTGLCGAAGLRDIVTTPMEADGGAFTLLCACDEGQQAREVPDLRQGLFSRALLEELEAAAGAGRPVPLDDGLERGLSERMRQLATRFGLPGEQRPWIKRCGPVPVLLRGRSEAGLEGATPGVKDRVAPSPNQREVCPACGLRNEVADTFQCRVCKRDYFCREHFVKAGRCCEECAARLASERQAASTGKGNETEQRHPSDEARKTSQPRAGATHLLGLGSGTTLVFCGIPPGEFLMGSTPAERDWAIGVEGRAKPESVANEGEAPRRTCIRVGFWMARTELTVGQWARFVEDTQYQTEAERVGHAWCFDWEANKFDWVKGKHWRNPNYGFAVRDDHPVACVTWNDVTAFCQWLTGKLRAADGWPAGWVCRLPTEAEWEYACRGGQPEAKFWWGDTVMEGQGRLNAASDDKAGKNLGAWPAAFPWSDGYAWVSPVDTYGARGRNGYGLADMLGNVWEWCLDGYDAKGAHEDCWTEDTAKRVLRGGSFRHSPGSVRCASRIGRAPTLAAAYGGVRVVLGTEAVQRVAAQLEES